MLVDTHCHLNFKMFTEDRESVVVRARQVGINRILNPGIDLQTSQAAVELSESYPEIYAAVGVHPNDALTWSDSTTEKLHKLAKTTKVVAIGEIGLDYYQDRAPRDHQKWIFIQQLELAEALELPVVIHTRNQSADQTEAMQDMLMILQDWKTRLSSKNSRLVHNPGVLHSFSDNLESAKKAIALGFKIGITGPVTFRNAEILQEVVASVALEDILVETDAPFLTPHPHRGKRNEPAYVRYVCEKIAEIRNVSVSDVVNCTTANANTLLQW